MSEGGGLLNDVDVTWETARVKMWDYNGNIPTAVPALCLTLVDEDGEKHEQYYSVGDAKNWAPSSDGKRLMPTGSTTAVVGTSNAGILMASLVNAGFPEGEMGEDLSVFDGLKCHMIQVPAPKRGGLAIRKRDDGRSFEPTILTVDKIISRPGEKKGSGTGGGKGKASTGGGSAPAADVEEKAQEIVLEILGAEGNEDGVVKSQLPKLAFDLLKSDTKMRGPVVQLLAKDEFLGDSERPWVYADGKVTMG